MDDDTAKDSESKGMEDNAFESLEKDFQATLEELMGDKSLEKFRTEYEKLHKALKKSHESEKRLMSKCRDLQAEIVANSAKVSTALKLSQEDQATIANLKKEIEKAWKMVDAAHEKEQRSRETITSLKEEIANLTKLVEQGAGLTMGQEQSVNDLLRIKEELTRERDQQLSEIVKLRERLQHFESQSDQLNKEVEMTTSKVTELTNDIQMRNNEIQRETRKKERIERELQLTKADLENKTQEIETMKTQLEKAKVDVTRLEQQLKEQRVTSERIGKENDELQKSFQKLQQECDSQTAHNNGLMTENSSKVAELKQRESEIDDLKKEAQRLLKMREAIQKKLHQVEEQKSEVEHQREIYKNQLSGLEKDVEAMKKQSDADKKALEELTREKDLLHKTLVKESNTKDQQQGLIKNHEQGKKDLENEITRYKVEAEKQRKIIFQLEKERDRYINEASELTQKVLAHMNEVKAREMQIFDYKRKIAETETKLKQQQNLYEAVRNDRNLYSKNLIESQDEITELKRKLKLTNHNIDQLKEEIASKDNALVKAETERQQVEKEKDGLKTMLQALKQEAGEHKALIQRQEEEEQKLLKIISEADAERQRQKKELDQVISERDILGTQLVRRNDELALLYEKMKIQQSILNKGEVQYKHRCDDIRILKLEIRKLRAEKIRLVKKTQNLEDLRREIYHLQKELLRERTRCKALEEELENPMNVHRWRKLEGTDPSTYELIQKIHTLQKRLIAKTEEVVRKELLIQEKEKLYVELKHVLARQPGPEVAEQLMIYRQTLKDKTKQLKTLVAEQNMYESQVQEYKFEIDKLSRELAEVKKKFFSQKKKEQKIREKDRVISQAGLPAIQPQRTDGERFTGGGFKLKQPTIKA